MTVDRRRILAFRARAQHLDERLPPGALPRGAHAGLQDSAPRAGVISLHARVDDVLPASWEDPSLAQIWFRGGADYIVPRADIGVFTLGSLSRDDAKRRVLEDIADRAHRVLHGRTLKVREVTDALALDEPFLLRAAAATGRLLIRWDASMIWLIPGERPDLDPEDARLELARRFLGWFGPATIEQYAKWAGVDRADAFATWDALGGELREVQAVGGRRWILDRDSDALSRADAVEGVRLLPHSDPFIKIDGELVVTDAELRGEVFPRPKMKPAFWPVSGGLLVNGEIVGSWARQQRRVTVNPWKRLGRAVRETIEGEAESFPIASNSKADVRWSD